MILTTGIVEDALTPLDISDNKDSDNPPLPSPLFLTSGTVRHTLVVGTVGSTGSPDLT